MGHPAQKRSRLDLVASYFSWLAVAVVMLTIGGCASGRTIVCYPGQQAERPLWVDGAISSGSLQGMGVSEVSLQDAQLKARLDVQSQIAEMVATRIVVKRQSLRTGDQVRVEQLIVQESRALLRPEWLAEEDHAYCQERTPGSEGMTVEWTYWTRVRFGKDQFERVMRDAQTTVAARLRSLENMIDGAEDDVREGRFRRAIEKLACIYIQNRSEWELQEEDLIMVAGRLLYEIVSESTIRIVAATMRDCSYHVRAQLQ